MKNEIKLFLEKLADDTDLQEKMAACKTPEEAYNIASSVQPGFTIEEFIEVMTTVKESIEAGEALSDEDLAKAAGGVTSDDLDKAATFVMFVTCAGTAATAVLAAC